MRSVGVDLVEGPLRVGMQLARANEVDLRLVCADARELPFAAGVFEGIAMVEVWEHVLLQDRAKLLAECRRVLKPGGRLVLSTPNYRGLVETFKRVVARWSWLKKRLPTMCYPSGPVSRGEYHPYRYHLPQPEKEIQRLLEEAGFQVNETRRVLFVLKNTPDFVFPLLEISEKVAESVPGIRLLASTLIVSAVRS